MNSGEYGFHWRDGWHFKRTDHGQVLITKIDYSSPEHKIVTEILINKDSWCSIIASVSAGGEENSRFYAANDFHDSVGQIAVIEKFY